MLVLGIDSSEAIIINLKNIAQQKIDETDQMIESEKNSNILQVQ
jgi:hypothetical protein